ncbi:glycosyltransferase family 61 protein [Burkholderia pseudomultivorans]|uniref:glycosyltransferase family 61 protein n=1 Tax=Burkholderia pseudomultivorans TaxID=1207504 RepID=UPI0028752F6A|nr:glycosyltransferase family 61 protein [Burkholderia pseudomultivorans]MDS0860108.1 glycosyltransferase family 61 protein [Burkholderia pseudomultivorans]
MADRVIATKKSPGFSICPPVVQGETLGKNISDRQMSAWNVGGWADREIRVLEIENALILHNGLVLRSDGSVVAESARNFQEDVIDKARSQFPELYREARRLEKTVLLCARPGGICYGHILAEIMGSAWLGYQMIPDKSWALLAGTRAGIFELYRTIAHYAGMNDVDFVNIGTSPTVVNKVYLVDGFAITGEYLSPLLADFSRRIIENIDGLADGCQKRKLFIARKPKDGRNINNHGEVRSFLESQGYETVYPEDLEWNEQVRYFNEATHIVGVMGSALSTAMFCKPGTKLLLMAPPGMLDTFFWRISAICQLNYHELRVKTIDSERSKETGRPLDKDVYVELGLLSDWVFAS